MIWDTSNSANSPDGFASSIAKDLDLSLEDESKIASQIRNQISKHFSLKAQKF
jgi:hypothetical protein